MNIKNKRAKRNKCRHFNGTLNGVCDKGIPYKIVADKDNDNDLPCVSWHNATTDCPEKSYYTEEEIAEKRRLSEKQLENYKLARKAITDHTGGKWGLVDEIDCPICKTGKLKFTVAAMNGHIHAICSTDGCMSWME